LQPAEPRVAIGSGPAMLSGDTRSSTIWCQVCATNRFPGAVGTLSVVPLSVGTGGFEPPTSALLRAIWYGPLTWTFPGNTHAGLFVS
jgi:hypothetical protein